jgi:hypothetical protein
MACLVLLLSEMTVKHQIKHGSRWFAGGRKNNLSQIRSGGHLLCE